MITLKIAQNKSGAGLAPRRTVIRSHGGHPKRRRRSTKREKMRLLGGIDIGTTKVCAIIGSSDSEGNITVLGLGSAPSRGVHRGMVNNISETVEAVRQSYEQAYELARVSPKAMLVGIAGDHISGINVEGTSEVRNPSTGIEDRDCRRAKKRAMKLFLPNDVEIIHSFTKEYIVNDRGGILDPVGLFGHQLGVKMHLVTSSVVAANNIFRCMRNAGMKTSSVVLQSVASSLAVLLDKERHMGVVLLDIGGGTTDIAIFQNETLQHIGEIAMGGDIITQDIEKILKLSSYDAENMKKKFGHAVPMEVDADERIQLPPSTIDSKRKMQSRRELSEIIEARIEEIFLNAQKHIQNSGIGDTIYAGIVLTGGTALLDGIEVVAERVMGYPCRIGRPEGLRGMNGVVSTPIYATGVGLLRWSSEEGPGYQRDPWIVRKLKDLFDIYG
jgi:cell division protein FtsA